MGGRSEWIIQSPKELTRQPPACTWGALLAPEMEGVTGGEGGGTGMDTGAEMTEDMEEGGMITGVGDHHLHIGGGVAGADPDHFHQGGTDIEC